MGQDTEKAALQALRDEADDLKSLAETAYEKTNSIPPAVRNSRAGMRPVVLPLDAPKKLKSVGT